MDIHGTVKALQYFPEPTRFQEYVVDILVAAGCLHKTKYQKTGICYTLALPRMFHF